jgi:transcriptional regulator with XRE-family HTH domain
VSRAALILLDRWVERELVRLTLRELREQLGKTQGDLAAKSKISQAELSRAERRRDHLISTLRRYVESLGGEIEVLAKFKDKRVRLDV